MQLYFDAMLLMPPNTSMVQGRDAILDAALKIGNKADAVGAQAVKGRMEAAKRTSVKDDRSRKPVLVSEQL